MASNAAHAAATFRISLNDCTVFLLNEWTVGNVRMRANTQFCGILTFAILSHLSVVLEEGKHLGENHQKLVIPAENACSTGIGDREPWHPMGTEFSDRNLKMVGYRNSLRRIHLVRWS
jgi:hypothetical protein